MAPRLSFKEALDELIEKYLDLEYGKIDICDALEDAFSDMDMAIEQEEFDKEGD